MNNKTLSIVAYITFIGWLIAYFSGKENADNNLKFHLRQGLALIIFSIILGVIINVVVNFTHLYFISYLGIINLVLMIIGIINASNEVNKPLPIIGNWAKGSFSFIG